MSRILEEEGGKEGKDRPASRIGINHRTTITVCPAPGIRVSALPFGQPRPDRVGQSLLCNTSRVHCLSLEEKFEGSLI